jgi:hypothetical protein
MHNLKFFSAVLLPVLAAAAVFSPILKYPLPFWVEPREVLFHLVMIAVLFFLLHRKVGFRTAMVGSLLFGLFPLHVFVWAKGRHEISDWLIYLGIFGFAALCALGFRRFAQFLKSQEPIVRFLFYLG